MVAHTAVDRIWIIGTYKNEFNLEIKNCKL